MSQYNKPVHAKRAPGDRTDGITKLQGDVTFATDGKVSIDLTVTEGGTSANASGYHLRGASGTSIPTTVEGRTVDPTTTTVGNATTTKVTSSGREAVPNKPSEVRGLANATAGKEYALEYSYSLEVTDPTTGNKRSVPKHLQGSVAKTSVVLGTTVNNVSLS